MYSTAIFNFPTALPYQNVRTNHHVVAPLPDTSTDQDGDYKVKQSEILQSPNAMYEVLEFIGRGTFGQVVKCLRKDSGELVAIKILKNHPNYARQGQVEIQILAHLSSESADTHNFVKALECFKHQNHTCLVFEILEKNLFDYLKLNKFTPMPLNHIRPILQQVLTALIKLTDMGVIHADIKPENIMLVNPTLEPFRVKLIDFGSATYTNRASDNTYLQSRYYRAPEVILGVAFTEKIDVWSLGCVIAELFLGWPLYPGGCEFDQIRFITSTEGLPPKHMLDSGNKSCQYFHPPSTYCSSWRIKSEDEYTLETGTRPKDTRKYAMKRLQDMCSFVLNDALNDQDKIIEELDRLQFVRLLIQMLSLDPAMRCSPKWCKTHEFVTMNHLQGYVPCKRVIQGIEVMQRACRREKPLSPLILTQQQQLKYILQQQVLSQAQACEQLHHLKKQQDLTWGIQAQSSSLQYYLNESLHNLSDIRPTQGIYPTPDWSPSSDWQQAEYGSKSRPILIPDSPHAQCASNDHLQQAYKAQLLRNLSVLKDATSQHPHFINPGTTLSNAGLPLSSLSGVLASRF